ncbi:MAG: caspase family protein [Proteobacteria bacterium]|nr:caspase family protein [Pseudomonadota bacterium]
MIRPRSMLAAFVAFLPFAGGASAQSNCDRETAALGQVASGVSVTVDAPANLRAGGKVAVTWRAKARAPLRTPVFIAISVPGDVRFVAPALASKPKLPEGQYEEPKPDLPGFLALPPAARGPLGLEFGRGQTRALVPLHQPGAKLTGTFEITNLAAGAIAVEAAVVARTSCGERRLAGPFGRTFKLEPGAPEVVVQDPYDIEQPRQVILSNDGRYRAHVFDNRYRVFDLRTGAKLIDRAGSDVNFSPTARFIVANAGSSGATGRPSYEIVDLATGDVAASAGGPFIGFAEADAFMIDARGDYGGLTVKPTLITRMAAVRKPGEDDPGDGLDIQHPGSCHACSAWTDDNVMLDLDNGILAYTGSFEADKTPVYELASGAQFCCKAGVSAANIIAQGYAVLPVPQFKGWQARTPIGFSHVYVPERTPSGADETPDKVARVFAKALVKHTTPAERERRTQVAQATVGGSLIRGDWRAKARRGDDVAPQDIRSRMHTELANIGLSTATALEREQIGFVNSSLSTDMQAYWDAPEATQKALDKKIAERTTVVEKRLVAEVPAIAPRLKSFQAETKPDGPLLSPVPIDDLEHGPIYLDHSLQGLWRWNVRGRAIWLLQMWATEGNGGIGEGTMTLLEGGGGAGGKRGAAVTELRFPGLPGVFSFQQFGNALDRPDLIKRRLASATTDLAAPNLVPPPELSVKLRAGADEAATRLAITARSTAPLKTLKLYADGQPIGTTELSGTTIAQEVAVPAAGGARWLTAQVVDAGGSLSNPQAVRLPVRAAPTRRLYGVIVGNNVYADKRYTLTYARHDAERLGRALAANAGHVYGQTSIKLLTDADATPENIRAELAKLTALARPEDTIVFSYAGHGLQQDGRYYLTPYNFDLAKGVGTAIAWRDIATELRRARSRVIVILDACQSGSSGTDGQATNDEAVKGLLSGEHPPMLVLAASKGRQSSLEDPKWDGGAFTHALVETLSAKRSSYDLDHDGAIELSELYRGLRQILARETGGEQTPWLVRQDLLGDFVVF